VKPADWYEEHDIELRTNATVQRVDTAPSQLQLEDDTALDYDRLVLCTGGSNQYLEVPGATLPGIYQLRSLAQCEAIRQAARPGAHAVIIGMGFIGAEVAASLRQMGLDVTVVLPGAAPLARVLGDEVATVLASIHQEHGVHLVTHDRVIGFEGRDRVERVLTAKGAWLDCDLVIVAIGIRPNVDVLSGSGIALDNGILPDQRPANLCRGGRGQHLASALRARPGRALQQRRKAGTGGGTRSSGQPAALRLYLQLLVRPV
jgi:3-phenylpropionate/trans-cinnamate dioxygenase ferredoxin reductase subunit